MYVNMYKMHKQRRNVNVLFCETFRCCKDER
nr:MAG TPA: hypothetical protein [Caudoviricetes sp.]